MGHLDIGGIGYVLSDGRPLLDDVTFRVGDGARVALVGPNGAGKTTLLRIVAGDEQPHAGSVGRSGGLGIMRQDIGRIDDDRSIRDLLSSLAVPAVRDAAVELSAAEIAIMETDDEPSQMRYAQALVDWADVGGYEAEAGWDRVTDAVLSIPFDEAQHREVRSLSGGEQKRLVLEALLRGPDEVLLLDEPDNALDVPTKRWLEEKLRASNKTVLFVSHDREMLANVATQVATLEPGVMGATVWVHGGGFGTYHQAREDRRSRMEELLRRWEEEHAKLKELVLTLKTKSAFNDGLASRYQAAQTRLRKFEDAGPPTLLAREQNVRVRLHGGRTAKRAVVASGLELTGLMKPFDLEVWFGERVAVLGSNGSGKSHFLRLLAAGGSDPSPEHEPADDTPVAPVKHTGRVVLGPRVRPGWFAQNHGHPELVGRTLLEILNRGDGHRSGIGREQASKALDRYELVGAAEQRYETLSGGQQARLQILLLELGGATLLLLDEPTDNLDLHSAEALETGLAAFEGTVLAVTHDRWFTRTFDRFLVFGADGDVIETPEPVWDVGRVERAR
ncbi:ABC-F family ATP-binding cassette domain-containing protein [Cellulomonas sp. URHD0024]|uniref:ABC-F family ATP-binding cassette domain-containing protein n=1 Tax=Cellulomonas sp. URHD0024 TaxID=1302620 RepID=UPI000427E9B1|nr:ATP-binding cassette domain-containing protein [Cellulomonas sp. URHD0024]